MEMVRKVWENVSAQTIANCFVDCPRLDGLVIMFVEQDQPYNVDYEEVIEVFRT